MFEFDLYEKSLHTSPAAIPRGSPPARIHVDRVSLLVWGEHCIECAAPDCFSSCDLYQARPDRRCRRFQFGIYPNRLFKGLRGAGAEVRFKVWGKLESRGNARLANARFIYFIERLLRAVTPLMHSAGRLLGKASGDIRFHYVSFTLLERLLWRIHRGRTELPDAFLVELYNPMAAPVVAQLTFAINRTSVGPTIRVTDIPLTVTKRLEIPPGYFRSVIPIEELRHVVTSGLRFGIAFTPQDAADVNLVFLTLDFVRFKDRSFARSFEGAKPTASAEPKAPTAQKQGIKCIVFDLDNTLWQGTLLESDDVRLRDGIVNLLQRLDARGILLSVASKNAFDHAWAKIREAGLDEYFVYPKINWAPKSENIRAIAGDLNIGLDTFAFVDDNPFERSEVAAALPMVDCVDVADLEALVASPRCAGSDSSEARNRRRSYQQESARTEQLASFGADYIGFLKSCQIVVIIRPFDEHDFGRVAELVQRTNQLNFSGHKYSRDEIRAIIDDSGRGKFVVACSDRFGSYGNVGFCITHFEADRVVVEDFMLSCRVQGKFVEQAVFNYLASLHPSRSARYVQVLFHSTDRNKPAQQVLEALQFKTGAFAGSLLDLGEHSLACDFIEVRDNEAEVI